MTDEELIARLRGGGLISIPALVAADHIEALVKYRNAYAEMDRIATDALRKSEARAERLEEALREIAAEASVPVRTGKNGINFKKMYEGWRKIAVGRIDMARAALKGVKT